MLHDKQQQLLEHTNGEAFIRQQKRGQDIGGATAAGAANPLNLDVVDSWQSLALVSAGNSPSGSDGRDRNKGTGLNTDRTG